MKTGGLRHPKSSKISLVRHPGAILGALGPSKASQVTFFLLFAYLLGYHFGAFSVLFHIKILTVFLESFFACICLKRYPPRDPGGSKTNPKTIKKWDLEKSVKLQPLCSGIHVFQVPGTLKCVLFRRPFHRGVQRELQGLFFWDFFIFEGPLGLHFVTKSWKKRGLKFWR